MYVHTCMENYKICNLLEAKAADEPFSNGWYSKHYLDKL